MDRSEAVQQILAKVAAAAPGEVANVLARECGNDARLRDEVESLLRSLSDAGRFLAAPTGEILPTAAIPPAMTRSAGAGEAPGTRIGHYKLLQQIGEGGFGVVFMAEQEKPVSRKVALKIIKRGMDTRQVIARFEAERQALAMMDHPNIARVLDAGETESGLPYFVMELCSGEPITTYCDRHSLTIHDRLGLFAQVCLSVQHAHTKGIIHRDLKPSNILVGTQDGRPQAKVIDFGIAKATAARLTEKTLFTEHRQLIGTPEYMSPEQAEGSLDIDTRTDVYSLGVLLYELLTGTTPFSSRELRSAAFAEIQRIIREVEPPRPSTRLSSNTETIASVAANRHTEPKRLGTIIRGELDWIVMKALEKDRQRRYETASSLGADIQRYLAGEAVVAAPPSTPYRIRKFVRRNRGAVSAAGAIAASLLIGAVAFAWQAKLARDQRDIAQQSQQSEARQRELAEQSRSDEAKARKRAETITQFVITALESSDAQAFGLSGGPAGLASGGADASPPIIPAARADMTILAAMDNAIKDLESGRFKDDPESEAALRETIGNILLNNARIDKARPLLEESLAMRERIFGAGAPIVAQSLTSLAHLHQVEGHNARAEPLLTRALDIRERALGKDHPSVAESLNHLADCFQARAKYAQAEPLYTRALAIDEQALGKQHPRVAETLTATGTLYAAQGKYDLAEPLFLRAVDIWEHTLGPDNFEVAKGLYSLGTLYKNQGKFSLAESKFERLLTIAQKALGPDHPIVASTLNSLAICYQKEGNNDAAEQRFSQALAIIEKTVDPNHPSIAACLNNLATVYQAQGKLDQAEPLFTRAVEIAEQSFGPNHPNLAGAINNLGALLLAQRRFDQAEPLFKRAMAICERSLGPDHPNTAGVLGSLACAHHGQGLTAEARTEFDAAITKLRAGAPEGSPLLARLLWRSGCARLDNHEPAVALPELQEALKLGEKLLPPEHPHLKDYREALTKCKAALGEQEKANTNLRGG